MKLKIEVTIRDNYKKLNEACKSVNFIGDWKCLTSEEKVYFYGLIKADIDYAIELEEQEAAV